MCSLRMCDYEHLDVKNCFYEKRLIGKLVLECENKILNTTETLLNDKKSSICKKLVALFILFH